MKGIGTFILIRISSGKEREIYKKLKELQGVILINEVFGERDIIIEVKIKDSGKLDFFVSEKIRKIKGVQLTPTMIVAR